MKNFQKKFNNNQPLTIVCIGDSTTSQEWCHPNWVDWLTFVFKQGADWPLGINRKIINSGADGQDIEYFLENFDNTIAMYKPDVVIMSLGFNNMKEFAQLEERAEKLIQKIKTTGSEIIIWSQYETPNPKYSEILSEMNDVYQRLALKFDAIFIDIYHEFKKYNLDKLFTFKHQWVNEEWGLKPGDQDYLHCNEIGNQIIAEKILKEAFNTDLSMANEWSGMGNMEPKNLADYLT